MESHARLSIRVESVHRLNNLGAVVTLRGAGDVARGLPRRMAVIRVLTVEGDLNDRCEIFDEADLDAAIARFDELHRPRGAGKRGKPSVRTLQACFAARDWDAITETFADDIYNEDRRRVVNGGSDAAEMR